MNKFIKGSLYKQTIVIYVLSLIIFSFIRLFLFFKYPNSFSELSTFEILSSLLMGMRIDIITLNTYAGIIIFALIIPFSFINRFKKVLFYLWFLILLPILYISLGDVIYFEHVGRHVSNELLSATGTDLNFILDMAFGSYLIENIAAFIVFIVFFMVWKKIVNIPTSENKFSLKLFGFSFLILIVLVLGVRGKIVDKPFGIADAFTTDKLASGNLAINGFYSLYRSANGSKNIKRRFLPKNEATTRVKQLLSSEASRFISDDYPLLREYIPEGEEKNHNIVIILLESWSSRYIDSFNGNIGLGATPNFDKLASQGLKFTKCYANGQRSIEGITSLMTGHTIPIGVNSLGSGLELSNLTYLGKIAKNHQYRTISMQSSKRSSYRVGSISTLAGFDEYYGAEDFPTNQEEQTHTPPSFGTWDGNMFRFLHQKLNQTQEPFMTFSFTASTHIQYVSPGEKWEKFQPHHEMTFNGFLNTLYYSDDMLGEFMAEAEKESWFDNTIFILTADHAEIFKTGTEINMKNIDLPQKGKLVRFEIPLVIYAPKLLKPAVIDEVVSQADILPSIIDFNNWRDSFSTISHSVFDTSVSNRFAFLKRGNIEYLVTRDGYLSHSLKKKTEGDDPVLEKDLLSIDQTFFNLISSNKVAPGAGQVH